MSSKDYLLPRSAQLASLKARTTSLQLCFRCAGFPGADLELELALLHLNPTSQPPGAEREKPAHSAG